MTWSFGRIALLLTLCCNTTPVGSHGDTADGRHSQAAPRTGPSAEYAFPLAAPGSYRLPVIKPAGDGRVLDETGHERRLGDLLRGRITVLAFMYTRCGDVCPTASLHLSVLQDLATKEGRSMGRLQLASMSFDPGYDTPDVLAEYAAHWRSNVRGAPAWHFLTASDRAALAPILAAYDQAVGPKVDPHAAGGPLHHIFRAFLIDPEGRIRNIYSLDFLDPELVLNDVKNLILQLDAEASSPARIRP
jgi:cytochrome oxidase Cu insertion factor (SCO1/SenC/PrrC family)